jgi:hypothetical protein
MKVTIIGAGRMGRGIGARAIAGGNDVEVIDVDPESAHDLAEELARHGGGSSAAIEPGAAISGEIVVLALYYPVISDAIGRRGQAIHGRALGVP